MPVVNGTFFRLVITFYRHKQTVYEKKRIERCKHPILPTFLLINHVVCDFGNLLSTELKTINVVDCATNVVLTYASSIHRQHLVFNVGHVAFVFWQNYRVKGGLTIMGTSISVSPIDVLIVLSK